MKAWTFISGSPEETGAYGLSLGQAVGAEGLAIALIGPLGAGKTVFVKGLAEGLGVDPRVVSSPTFVIAQQYVVPTGPEALHHVDLYRLESEDELESIGFFDMFAPGSVVAVEWADRLPDVLGREFLKIELEGPTAESEAGHEGATRPGRSARVVAEGARAQLVLADWAARSERSAAAGGGLRRIAEMRLHATLLLAIGLFLGALLSPADEAPRSCAALRPIAEDALGTSRLECISSAPAAPSVTLASAPAEPVGIARLLAGGTIDLNRASPALLESLPGIGPARARAIAAARPFAAVGQLEDVPGIGPKTRQRLERWLRVVPHEDGSAIADAKGTRDG